MPVLFTSKGCSISRKIIELHGGDLSFHSPPEGGTTFTIEIPMGYLDQTNEWDDVFVD